MWTDDAQSITSNGQKTKTTAICMKIKIFLFLFIKEKHIEIQNVHSMCNFFQVEKKKNGWVTNVWAT